MDSKKIENSIIESILSSREINLKNISDKELKDFIKGKVIKANYLEEEWQIHYTIERIFKEIKSHLKPSLKNSGKKGQTFNFLINFAIAVLFYSVLKILLKEAFPSFIGFGGLPSVIILGICYFIVAKARDSSKGKEILYNILVALVIFPFLAVNIGKYISTDSAWPILPLFILAYILAKPARIIFKKTLDYIGGIFKKLFKK